MISDTLFVLFLIVVGHLGGTAAVVFFLIPRAITLAAFLVDPRSWREQ